MPKLYRYFALHGVRGETEDLTQETLLLVWRRWPPRRKDVSFQSFVFMNARRVGCSWMDRQRSPHRPETHTLTRLDLIASPRSGERENRETVQQVREALLRLPPDEWHVMFLRQEGLTGDEIASALDMSRATVFRLFTSAREKLRGRLAPIVHREEISRRPE